MLGGDSPGMSNTRRRIQKSFTQNSVITTTNYVYDGDNLIEELDASGNVLVRYIQGLGVDETLADVRNGITSFYEADVLGSTTSLTDRLGGIVATYDYDSFGNTIRGTEIGHSSTTIRYTGRVSAAAGQTIKALLQIEKNSAISPHPTTGYSR
jgi:uncharacterized protein RhaS with RHS repeats